MEKNKKTILQAIVCVGLLCVIWGGYYFANRRLRDVNEINRIRKSSVSFSYNMLGEVEDITYKNGKAVLSGWAMQLNAEIARVYLILQPVDGGDAEVIPAECVTQDIMSKYYMVDEKSDEVRFTANLNEKKIQKDMCYEVLLWVEYEEAVADRKVMLNRKITTGEFLYEGAICRCNPKTFSEPEITDEEMVKVMKQGSLRAYDLEKQIWIYQYENKLYYIIKQLEKSLTEADICIPVMPSTLKKEVLPEHRQQYGFDHWGSFSEDESYAREGILPYQVVTVGIKEEYPVTYISTGLYDNVTQEWIKQFRITLEK